MQFDAAVVGAGPAGSTAARLLAKAGWRVALIEKAEFPRHKVCGEFISAATMPLLEACGIASAFFAGAGPPVRQVALYAGNRITQAPLPSGGGRALGREHLDLLLRDAALAAGAMLFQPAELIALERHPTGYLCRLQSGESLQARMVIAASGSWNSKGPFALDRPARPSDLLGFKAHFRRSPLPEDLMPLLAFPGGYGGMVHSDAGRVSLSCCVRRDALATIRARHGGRAAEAVFAHIAATTKGAALALAGAEPDGAFLSAGPIRPGIRTRYRDGIFFTGNLGGEAHPVIAEGISMAVQSSTLLAKLLIGEADIALAGRRYSRAWRQTFAPRLEASRLFAHIAMQPATRALAAALVHRMPALLTFGACLAGKAP